MEIILALVVAVAVIFFGALISAGNERQRKAIDGLRDQVVMWATQDLRIKREKLARDVRVDDPLGWLNRVATKVCGYDMDLQVVEAFDTPQALICGSAEGNSKIILSPHSPNDIRLIRRDKRSRLSQYAERNPLFSLPRNTTCHELSVLSCGILFDLELPLAWKGLTGQVLGQSDCLWMYRIL
ncbi:MAG: hypothetical protein HZC39_13355 [Chloroflexi bacterium]|nr:hypothetical protein [Chloroflexota bacterium]MBI5704514.1 hypothetical protein [Chloroflexota bacterium]GER78869.1 conserved hypothetical protein [Candidatus Denitrolinea symbiosum]